MWGYVSEANGGHSDEKPVDTFPVVEGMSIVVAVEWVAIVLYLLEVPQHIKQSNTTRVRLGYTEKTGTSNLTKYCH